MSSDYAGSGSLIDRSMGAVASRVVKASAGKVYAYSCMNLNSSIRYFQLFNRATALAGGETPIESWPVLPTGGLLIVDPLFVGEFGANYGVGITWGFSTTARTYTAGTATDAVVIVRYE